MDKDTDSPPSGPRNVLLRTGEDGDCDESACMGLLGIEEPSDVDVLFVTFTKSAGDRLAALKRHADAPPARVGVVSVDVGGSTGGDRVGGAGGPTVRRISDPSDLTGVGIAISEFLSAWSGDGNRTVVCFESLTALLQYVDASRVFQFCNEITSKFERADARAHFHITPGAHERQELSVLSSLFDGRVSAADLGHGPDAEATTEEGTDAAVPETGAAGDDASDEIADDTGDGDPFEYAVADAVDGSEDGASDDEPAAPVEEGSDDDADDAVAETDDAGSPARTGEEDPAGDGSASPDSDPADLVSSVIAGEANGDEIDHPDDGGSGPSLDADVPEAGGSDEDASDDARPATTARRAEREGMRRRLEYIGPDASTPESTAADADDDEAQGDDGEDPADRSEKYAFYQRTTATVVGVVVMLVLISFLSAAMPVPIGTDAPGGGDVTPTATPDEVAAADATGDDGTTATEETSTPGPTATATTTATPTPTSAPSTASSSTSSSTSGSSDDGSTSERTATATPTPEPTETATPTDTPTDDNIISKTLDSDDDGLL